MTALDDIQSRCRNPEILVGQRMRAGASTASWIVVLHPIKAEDRLMAVSSASVPP